MKSAGPLLALALALGAAASGASAADAPVKTLHDFVAPLFDLKNGGIKIGELRGETATYLSAELADFGHFKYTAFLPDQSVQFTVESDNAMVYIRQKLVLGEGTIHVTSPEYEITGSDWRADLSNAKAQHVTIQKGVRLVFRNVQLGDILK